MCTCTWNQCSACGSNYPGRHRKERETENGVKTVNELLPPLPCMKGKMWAQVNIRPQRGRLWSKPRGHDLRKSHWQNSKSEYRNSKQIQISNSLMTKTKSYSRCQIRLLFGSFKFWSLNIVSDFGFRAPGLESLHFIRQSH